MSLNVSATFPARPTQVPGSRTVKSPSRIDWRLVKMTVRSREPSAVLDFPLFFPLVLARVAGRFSVRLGATWLSADLFMASPEQQRSNPIPGHPAGYISQP